MKIEVVATAQSVKPEQCKGKTVVVIDVLRATSVIVTALANGATKVVPVATIDEAKDLHKQYAASTALLAGEREGKIIAGFHLGNSPLMYCQSIVETKNIILTTSNGTQAICNCIAADRLVTVSFLNVNFAAKNLAQTAQNLVIVCAGTNGNFSMDDALCAGMLIDGISKYCAVECCDLGETLLQAHRNKELTLTEKLKNCLHVKYLESIDCADDIKYCLQTDVFDVLPEYQGDGLYAFVYNEQGRSL